jgi:hypothetical protein
MNNCIQCQVKLPDERIHLGYKECVECSSVEPYSAHIVYPHKTGAFVQPVSQETKKNLDRLDRRAVKVGGKMSAPNVKEWTISESKPKVEKKQVEVNYNHKKFSDVFGISIDIYKQSGYDKTINYLSEMFKKNKISLMTKINCVNNLTDIHLLNRKQRKMILK